MQEHHGIDGLYENMTPPPKYFVVDSKYLSSEASKADTIAPTMTYNKGADVRQLDDVWIENNIWSEFKDANGTISKENLDKIDEILDAIATGDETTCLRLGAKVDNTGKVTYYKYGSDGKVLKEPKKCKNKKVPVIWNKE